MIVSTDQKRLAEIRAKLIMFSTETDTSTWEATLFFKIIDEQRREIQRLKGKLK